MARAKKTKADKDTPIAETANTADGAVVVEGQQDGASTGTDEDVQMAVEDLAADPPEDAESSENRDVEQPPEAATVVKRGGFFPLFLGGVVAAGIGFAGAVVLSPDNWPFGDDKAAVFEAETASNFAAQNQTINALRGQITDLAAKSDTSGIASDATRALGGIEDLGARLDAQSAKINDLQFRLSDLERRPITEGISDAAIAAFEAELKAVQDAMLAQRSEIEAASEAAAQKEASAQISEAEAMKRAALSQIQTALNVGAGFAPAVANLIAAGETVPDVLVQTSETGVPSIAALQEAFPIAARVALTTAEGGADEQGGIGAFLRNQLGARSLEPKDGNSVDAILSRAEAALREGRLLDATAELQGLPEAGQAAMADWQAIAEKRQEALAAVEVLSQQLNSN